MDINFNTMSAKLKQRFCTDCNLPINIFQEPYFIDRLWLYNKYYNTCNKWYIFAENLANYKCEQDYFEDYNRVKDEAINFIKSTEAYQSFCEEDMNQYEIVHKGLPSKDIFHQTNDGKTFISIDMRKANFSTLYYYDPKIFDYAETWEEFISKFTDNQHIINSKYIRQVILGNCNPRRQITYEKYLMDVVLNGFLLRECFTLDKVVFFSNDEIIIDISDLDNENGCLMVSDIKDNLKHMLLPLKVEHFKLHKIEGTQGYCKEIFKENGETEIKFKCVDSLYMPFIIRKFLGQEVQENDKVFYHNGLLAKFIEVPGIKIDLNETTN